MGSVGSFSPSSILPFPIWPSSPLKQKKVALNMSEANTVRRSLRRSNVTRPADLVRLGFLTSLGVVLLALLALIVWRLSGAALSIITPFVLGTMLAMLLDPVVDRLQKYMSRGFAVFLVFGVFVSVLLAVGVYGVPALVGQVEQFSKQGPVYLIKLRTDANNFLKTHHKMLVFTLPKNVDVVTSNLMGSSNATLQNTTERVTNFLIGSVTTLLDIVLTLIITFYLLLDIDRLRARLFYLAPERARAPMSQYGRDIGGVFTGYLRGLLIVCALYGMATMLLFFGLAIPHHDLTGYALLMGVVGGLLYTVPYVGPIATALVTFLLAASAGGMGFGAVAVGLTLLLNQVFDNIVTPKMVGRGVGLHPVASLFALTLGGTLFGLWGLLLSVPVAASIQVILFRLFPKLTTPTPAAFLRAQEVPIEEGESAKTMESETPRLPDVSPQTSRTVATDKVPSTAQEDAENALSIDVSDPS
jgi:predicted PurR-regulated permease PerM